MTNGPDHLGLYNFQMLGLYEKLQPLNDNRKRFGKRFNYTQVFQHLKMYYGKNWAGKYSKYLHLLVVTCVKISRTLREERGKGLWSSSEDVIGFNRVKEWSFCSINESWTRIKTSDIKNMKEKSWPIRAHQYVHAEINLIYRELHVKTSIYFL